MPWHLDSNKSGCSGVAVVKDSDGSIAGCHPNRPKASAQLRALYANEAGRVFATIMEAERLPMFFEQWQMDTISLSRIARREVRPVLTKLGRHVADAVRHGGGLVTEDTAERRVDYILTLSTLTTFADRYFAPVIRKAQERAALRTAARINQAFRLAVDPAEVARYVLETGGRRAGLLDLHGHSRAALMRLIDQAREQGIAVKKFGRQVIANEVSAGRFVNAGPAYRGQLIARTETLHAQRVASLTSYRVSGRVASVQAYDGDEDEECAARNGEFFSLDDADIETDAEHPNGTLAWGPVVQEAPTL